MSSLTNEQIRNSYQGLIKTTDNTAVGATEKQLTDGLGNPLPLTAGTSGVSFTGGVDFTGATITGLPTSEAGLVAGTGLNSLKNSDSLVTTPAVANAGSIVLGNGATDNNAGNSVVIGSLARASNGSSISLGYNAKNSNSDCSIAIGRDACVEGWSRLIAIGCGAKHVGAGYGGAAIGCNSLAYGPGVSIGNQAKSAVNIIGVSIGDRTCAVCNNSIAIGFLTTATGACAVSIGNGSTTTSPESITIGNGATSINTSGAAIAIGRQSCTTWGQQIAIGDNAKANSAGAGAVISIGGFSSANANETTVLGYVASAVSTAAYGTAIGAASKSCAQYGTALGRGAVANASGATALGANVTAAKVDTVTVKELETCVAGGGIIMTTPDGLSQYKITVDNSGNLVSTVVV